MLDPRSILIAIPCYDGKLMVETAGMLLSCQGLFGGFHGPPEVSHVSLVRNLIAGQFLASSYEWLVCIDADIAFSRQDLELLLEPCDTTATYLEDHEVSPGLSMGFTQHSRPAVPRPTRVVLAQSASLEQREMKSAAAADSLVCAEYCYKNDMLEPVHLGLGFTRIHRSVFKVLEQLKHESGPRVEVSREVLERLRGQRVNVRYPDDFADMTDNLDALFASVEDPAGSARLWQCSHKGRRYTDFYPSGPILSQFVPTAQWKGEDHGFFTLCMLAGIIPRIETRTRLTHIGRKGYPYLGPDLGGGQ